MHPKHRPQKPFPNKRPEHPEAIRIRGRHEVLRALQTRQRLSRIFLLSGAKGGQIPDILNEAREQGIPVDILEGQEFQTKAGFEAQGVAALLPEFPYFEFGTLLTRLESQEQALVLALNHLEDPRNLGAIVRTAECAGTAAILIPKDRAAGMTEWAIQTSQGAAFDIPIVRVTNVGDALRKLQDEHFWVVGLSEAGAKRYDQHQYAAKTVLVAGGEDQGLGTVVAKLCDDLVKIPMSGNVGSLNVSVSVGIALFEILRQRNFVIS